MNRLLRLGWQERVDHHPAVVGYESIHTRPICSLLFCRAHQQVRHVLPRSLRVLCVNRALTIPAPVIACRNFATLSSWLPADRWSVR